MQNKTALIAEIDQLISKYGKTNPELLRDLQSHRSAIANAFNKKEIVDAAYKFVYFVKTLYDLFMKE